MIEPYGIWWPDFETGGSETINYMFGRVNDVDVATALVRTKGIAVQAGGHCGLWPRQLAKHFSHVFTFEPIPDMYGCLLLNTKHLHNVSSFNAALGAEHGGTLKFSERRSGRSKADPEGDIEVPVHAIDSLELPRCDLIYLDVEGYELEALKGAAKTIASFRPIIVTEILKGKQEEVTSWASSIGYSRAGKAHNDWIWQP